jgi:hypothetical protein
LATFYVFDKENIATPGSGVQLVGHGCGGCHGHGCGHWGWGGCIGIGIGCGGCGGGGGYWCWINGARVWCY